jgi:hypothetical protein
MSDSLLTGEQVTDMDTSADNPGNQSSESATSPVRSADGFNRSHSPFVESPIPRNILLTSGRKYICSFFEKFSLKVWLKL